MKIISWNVNGLNAAVKNDFNKTMQKLEADIICLQETKVSRKPSIELEGYYQYYNYCKKAGYSGVAIFTKEEPIKVLVGVEIENDEEEFENIDNESRVITVEFDEFYIVSVYVPHSQGRYNYRQNFDYDFLQYIEKLQNKKDVIICGDFNICHEKIDVCDFEHHTFLNSFNDEEKANFEELLNLGFIDSYRYLHPQMREFTFWKHNENRDKKETGWRLDYILVSEYLTKYIREANILKNIRGSDHCPVELIIRGG